MSSNKKHFTIKDIETLISEENENKNEIKRRLSQMIRGIRPACRCELIKMINNRPVLGNIEDYLSDFLYIKHEGIIDIEKVIYALNKTDSIDKGKLFLAIKNNFNLIFNSLRRRNDLKCSLIDFLYIIQEIEDELTNTQEVQKVVQEVNKLICSNYVIDLLKENHYDINLMSLFRKFNIDNSQLKECQDDIINTLSHSDLIRYMESARENEGFEKDWDAYELTKQFFKNDRLDEISLKMVSKLIEELCAHENIEVTDIKYAKEGFFSDNIKIGNYILKLGKRREVNNIPNDKRIIKPLLRQQSNIDERDDKPNLFIEIQNVVDTNWYEGLTQTEIKEQLYIIYSELRDRGKVWTDIKFENVGRLLRPNKENFEIEVLNEKGELEKKELKSSNYAISFTGDEPDEVLQPGELVIIDTDYIYNEDNVCDIATYFNYNQFETRYKKEKRLKRMHEGNIGINGIKEILKDGKYTREDLGKIQAEIKSASLELIDDDRGKEK